MGYGMKPIDDTRTLIDQFVMADHARDTHHGVPTVVAVAQVEANREADALRQEQLNNLSRKRKQALPTGDLDAREAREYEDVLTAEFFRLGKQLRQKQAEADTTWSATLCNSVPASASSFCIVPLQPTSLARGLTCFKLHGLPIVQNAFKCWPFLLLFVTRLNHLMT